MDWQFAAEPPVNEYAQRYFGRSSEIKERIQCRAYGPAGVQHIINEYYFLIFNAERYISGIGYVEPGADIIAVKSYIQLAILDMLRINNFVQFMNDTVAQEYATGLQAYKHGIGKQQVIFQYLVCQPFYGQCQLLFG